MEIDKYARSANYRVHYPGSFLRDLNPVMRPFVLLEVGVARVTPFVQRRLRSFVHDYLDRRGQLSLFDDNRPKDVRCVHPLVTLLEKLDAIMRRHPREPMEPASFVRHYEDAAQIVPISMNFPRSASTSGHSPMRWKPRDRFQDAPRPEILRSCSPTNHGGGR